MSLCRKTFFATAFRSCGVTYPLPCTSARALLAINMLMVLLGLAPYATYLPFSTPYFCGFLVASTIRTM